MARKRSAAALRGDSSARKLGSAIASRQRPLGHNLRATGGAKLRQDDLRERPSKMAGSPAGGQKRTSFAGANLVEKLKPLLFELHKSVLTRNHPSLRTDLLAAVEPLGRSDDQHVGECRQSPRLGASSVGLRRASS